MKLAICVLGLMAMAAATVVQPAKELGKSFFPLIFPSNFFEISADKNLLMKQKMILELVWRLTQPTIFPKIAEIAQTYDIQANMDKYNVSFLKIVSLSFTQSRIK